MCTYLIWYKFHFYQKSNVAKCISSLSMLYFDDNLSTAMAYDIPIFHHFIINIILPVWPENLQPTYQKLSFCTHTPQPTWHYSTLSIFLVCCFWPINPLGTSLGYFPFSRFASHPFALVRWYSRMQTRNKKDSQPPLVSFAKSFLYSIKLTLTQILSCWIHYFTLLKKVEVNSIE